MLSALLASSLALAPAAGWVALTPGPGPVTNPFKGYAPYATDDTTIGMPYSLVYHYVSWRDLEPEEGVYRFEEWAEATWENANSKGKHLVSRIYLDYPSRPTGVPQWLIDKGIKMTPYTDHGGGLSPDYDDPRLRAALAELIAEAGRRWNPDPRVAFVQLGILGFWGEWHTWPRDEMFASLETQREVIDGLRAALPDKHLMARNPIHYQATLPWIGYHDDMIPDDTLGPDEWMFLPTMARAGRVENWKVAPTGGEMVPFAAERLLGPEWETLKRAVREAHFSWIGPYCPAIVDLPTPQLRERALELSRMLGYEFRWTRVNLARAGGKTKLSLEGVNQGVAPFYFPWKLAFAWIDAKGQVVSQTVADADVRKWLPGPISAGCELPAGPKGARLAVGILDPASGRPAVAFANQAPSVKGWMVIHTPVTL